LAHNNSTGQPSRGILAALDITDVNRAELTLADIAQRKFFNWLDGHFIGVSDEEVLREAARQSMTLLKFDLKTVTHSFVPGENEESTTADVARMSEPDEAAVNEGWTLPIGTMAASALE